MNQKILLGVTGGIAVYKAVELLRLLQKQGHQVRVVMSEYAKAFVTPLTFETISGFTAPTDPMAHIELARWADEVLIAPATANCIAKLAHGIADDLLSTLCLATIAPVTIAPAMNQQMWLHPATQDNLRTCLDRGISVLGPGEGEQACGEVGPGRMLEPMEIVEQFTQVNPAMPDRSNLCLTGRQVVITAGPTHESVDPIRYFTNRSTGTMGYAIAKAAEQMGAKVTLISGPTKLTPPRGVNLQSVVTANEMYSAVMDVISEADIFISAAAVADYRPSIHHDKKLKKSDQNLQLTMVRNPDILATVTDHYPNVFSVGFAAETNDLIRNAEDKLEKKGLDILVANTVSETAGFGESESDITLLFASGDTQPLGIVPKPQFAHQLINIIADALEAD